MIILAAQHLSAIARDIWMSKRNPMDEARAPRQNQPVRGFWDWLFGGGWGSSR
jgi:hypothetical protein